VQSLCIFRCLTFVLSLRFDDVIEHINPSVGWLDYIHTLHTYIHRLTKTDLIICPMLWYSNGTDKNRLVCRPSLSVAVTHILPLTAVNVGSCDAALSEM